MQSIFNIGERIREERTRLGLTQQEVADFVEITRQTQAKYEKGDRSPDALYLEKIIDLGFNSYYILTGNLFYIEPSHLEDDDEQQEDGKCSEESASYIKRDTSSKEGHSCPAFDDKVGHELWYVNDEYARIPLFDVKASAGNGFVIHHEEEMDALIFKKEWIYNELHSTPANLYLIYVEGESMEPSLRPGDVILVDHTDNVAKRDGIYVIRMGDSLLVKRLQRLPNRVLKVNSDNPDYESFEISLDVDHGTEFMIIGRVLWSGRRH